MSKKVKVNHLKLFLSLCFIFILVIALKANAQVDGVEIIPSEYASIEVTQNGSDGGKRDLVVYLNNISPGKRITDIKFCIVENDCDSESNWMSTYAYDNSAMQVHEFDRGIGDDQMAFWVKAPDENIKIKVDFTDFEPMNISYSKYLLHEVNSYSGDQLNNFNNYENEFAPLINGYIGGDIVLPSDCLANGCVLKMTLSNENYNLDQISDAERNIMKILILKMKINNF